MSSPILQQIQRLVDDHCRAGLSDAELLRQFNVSHDEGSFQTLLRRHGPMVLDVCRSLLPNEADAEDAFQATFLILAHKARSIRKTTSLASWLHGVAHRTALKARASYARRRKHEPRAARREASSPEELSWGEVLQVLHEELGHLASRHRAPLVLCYLQGMTQDAAAALLGLAKGTLKGRLERGRALLRERLVRRGLGPAAVLLAVAGLGAGASAEVPRSVVAPTVQAACSVAAGQSLHVGIISAQVISLAKGALHTMTTIKVLLVLALVLAVGGVGVYVTGLGAGQGPERKDSPSAPAPGGAKSAGPKDEVVAPKEKPDDGLAESQAVRVNGVELRAVVEPKRPVPTPPGNTMPFDLGLRFTNHGDRLLVFNLFDTVRPVVTSADGRVLKPEGDRDRSVPAFPIFVGPGKTETVLRRARLEWLPGNRALRLVVPDGSGGIWYFDGLRPGNYLLSFEYENAETTIHARPTKLEQGQSVWVGKATTAEVEFELTPPEQQAGDGAAGQRNQRREFEAKVWGLIRANEFKEPERRELLRLGTQCFPLFKEVLSSADSLPQDVSEVLHHLTLLSGDRRQFHDLTVARLTDENLGVRDAAVHLLRFIGSPEDSAPLVALLDDRDEVGRAAAEALGAIGGAREQLALEIWVKLHPDLPSAVVRKHVRLAMDQIASRLAGSAKPGEKTDKK